MFSASSEHSIVLKKRKLDRWKAAVCSQESYDPPPYSDVVRENNELVPFGGTTTGLEDSAEDTDDTFAMDPSNDMKCNEHPRATLRHDEGGLFCSVCGETVQSCLKDSEVEVVPHAGFGARARQTRCGWKEQPYATGSEVNSDTRNLLPTNVAGRSHNATKRSKNISFAINEIEDFCAELPIESKCQVRSKAISLMEMCAASQDKVKMKFGKHLAGACVYVAGRMCAKKAEQGRILDFMRQKKCKIGANQRSIIKTLKLDLPLLEAVDLIPEYCSELLLPHELQDCALYIETKVSELGLLNGKNPRVAAAAIIYLACQGAGGEYALGKKEISAVAGISVGLIKNMYITFVSRRDEDIKNLFPPDFKFGIPDLVFLPVN